MEFTAGKVIVHGNKVTRGQIKKADYLLNKENIQLAIVSKPRYYQRIAIDKTVAEVAKDQRRILLVMATGTGKTYTAF